MEVAHVVPLPVTQQSPFRRGSLRPSASPFHASRGTTGERPAIGGGHPRMAGSVAVRRRTPGCKDFNGM